MFEAAVFALAAELRVNGGGGLPLCLFYAAELALPEIDRIMYEFYSNFK